MSRREAILKRMAEVTGVPIPALELWFECDELEELPRETLRAVATDLNTNKQEYGVA